MGTFHRLRLVWNFIYLTSSSLIPATVYQRSKTVKPASPMDADRSSVSRSWFKSAVNPRSGRRKMGKNSKLMSLIIFVAVSLGILMGGRIILSS